MSAFNVWPNFQSGTNHVIEQSNFFVVAVKRMGVGDTRIRSKWNTPGNSVAFGKASWLAFSSTHFPYCRAYSKITAASKEKPIQSNEQLGNRIDPLTQMTHRTSERDKKIQFPLSTVLYRQTNRLYFASLISFRQMSLREKSTNLSVKFEKGARICWHFNDS